MNNKLTYQTPMAEFLSIGTFGMIAGSSNTGEDYKPTPLELGNGGLFDGGLNMPGGFTF